MQPDITQIFPEIEKELRLLHTTGLIPSQGIEELVKNGHIVTPPDWPIRDDQIQPASIDLRLGPVAYRVRASFLPGEQATVRGRIEELFMHEIDLTKSAVLEKGCVYMIPLLEELRLPAQLSGKANPKSTTGRLDIFTRLITDYTKEFERVKEGYKGKLYLEVVPKTFSVLVRQGTKLNQLRFVRGAPPPSDTALDLLHEKETLVYRADDEPADATISKGLWVSIDLKSSSDSKIIGYRAKHHAPLINLEMVNFYDPSDYWEPIQEPKTGHLILNPDDFYILISKEKVRVPPQYAAAMVPYDPSIGEFRIHYAGFFDPGFGYGSSDIKGTRAVLEVRSHEVPFLLEDGQAVGRLIYERLLTMPKKIYGVDIGSSYQCQELSLSKQFKRT